MGAVKDYYATLATFLTDDDLRKYGWSEEQIARLRECFGECEQK